MVLVSAQFGVSAMREMAISFQYEASPQEGTFQSNIFLLLALIPIFILKNNLFLLTSLFEPTADAVLQNIYEIYAE